jgi:hypothetical protein
MGRNEILDVKNYDCFIVMRSLNSRKYVSEIFNWQWHYYFLKPEGIKFLREQLGLPDTIIPNTHKVDSLNNEENTENNNEETRDEKRGEKPTRGGRTGRGGRGGRVEA